MSGARRWGVAVLAVVAAACNGSIVFDDGAAGSQQDASDGCVAFGCAAPLVCDRVLDVCVQCLTNTDCALSARRCDTAQHTCGPCQSAADCPDGNACDASGACIETCLNGLACPDDTPICDPRGICVACSRRSDCPTERPICDTQVGQCTGCTRSAQCPEERPVCNTASGTCGPCLSAADCPADHPICQADGTCED